MRKIMEKCCIICYVREILGLCVIEGACFVRKPMDAPGRHPQGAERAGRPSRQVQQQWFRHLRARPWPPRSGRRTGRHQRQRGRHHQGIAPSLDEPGWPVAATALLLCQQRWSKPEQQRPAGRWLGWWSRRHHWCRYWSGYHRQRSVQHARDDIQRQRRHLNDGLTSPRTISSTKPIQSTSRRAHVVATGDKHQHDRSSALPHAPRDPRYI